MPTLRSILACCALAALTAFLIAGTVCVYVVTEVASRLPQEINGAILETRAQVLGQIADFELHTLKHLTALEVKADGRIASIEADARAELVATRELVNSQLGVTLGKVDVALAEVRELHAELRPTIENVAGITRQTEEALPLFLDCENNADCAFNRFQGTSKAVERAAQNIGAMSTEIRASVPQQLAAVEKLEQHAAGIAADVHTVTSEYTKPVGFWRKLWGAAKTGLILYVRTL